MKTYLNRLQMKIPMRLMNYRWAYRGFTVYLFIAVVLYVLVLPSNIAYSTILFFLTMVIPLVVWLNFGKNTYLKRFVFAWLILIFVATFGTYSLGYYLKELLRLNPEVIRVGSISDWIGFAGAIFGSTTTLIAVAFTLFYESVEERDSRTISMLPLLNVDYLYKKDSKFDTLDKSILEELNEDFGAGTIEVFRILSSNIIIKNLSNNLVREARISEIQYLHDENRTFNILKNTLKLGTILPVSDVIVPIDLNLLLNKIVELNQEAVMQNYKFSLIIKIEYFDLSKSQATPYEHIFKSDVRLVFSNFMPNQIVKLEKEDMKYNHDYKFLALDTKNNLDLSRFNTEAK